MRFNLLPYACSGPPSLFGGDRIPRPSGYVPARAHSATNSIPRLWWVATPPRARMSEPLGLKVLRTGNSLMSGAPCIWTPAASIAWPIRLSNAIEVCTRLPEINHTLPALDRPGRMEQQATRRIGRRIDVSVHLVELPLCTPLDLRRRRVARRARYMNDPRRSDNRVLGKLQASVTEPDGSARNLPLPAKRS